jgi:hypothetical protein
MAFEIRKHEAPCGSAPERCGVALGHLLADQRRSVPNCGIASVLEGW